LKKPNPTAPVISEGAVKDLADTVRSMLYHESDAIHQRMGWLGTFQGLLLAGTCVMWDKGKWPVFALCCLGIAVSALIAASLRTASIATGKLLDWWDDNKPLNYRGPGVIGFFAPPAMRWVRIIAPWFLLPFLFLATWVGLLGLDLWRATPSITAQTPTQISVTRTSPIQLQPTPGPSATAPLSHPKKDQLGPAKR
jgi:hypothetical protein